MSAVEIYIHKRNTEKNVLNYLFILVKREKKLLKKNVVLIRKPLSAKTRSPFSKSDNIPDFRNKSLSEMAPPHKSEINDIALEGVMPIRLFTVLQFL